MTQSELGKAAGVSASHVSTLERGMHDPPLSVMVRLADALGTSLPHLFELIEAER